MIKKVLPLLNKLIPSSLARKGLAKNIPQLDGFFESALAAGYGLDHALDFLRNEVEGNEEGMRADELAANARVEQQGLVGKGIHGLGNIAGLGIGAAAVPSVIGSLFQPKDERSQQPPSMPPPNLPPHLQKDKRRIAELQAAKNRQQSGSEFSPEALQEQLMQGQNQQGKENLLNTMKEITEALRRMRGQGG